MQEIIERNLNAEQRMMRDSIRAYVDNDVKPFIRKNWQKEWDMVPENRPSLELLRGAHSIGVRGLCIPGEFGGTPRDTKGLCNQAKLFASEEIFKVRMHAVELHGGNGIMLDFGVEKFMRDASLFLHRDATVDISKFKIVKAMFPHTAGKYAGPEN